MPSIANVEPLPDPQARGDERTAHIRNKALLAKRAWGAARASNWLERFLGRGRRSGRHVSAADIANTIQDVKSWCPEFTFSQAAAHSADAETPRRGVRSRQS